MSRPRCWVCFKQLMYVNGVPVFAVLTDPSGVDHKVHKACMKAEKAARECELTKNHREFRMRGAA